MIIVSLYNLVNTFWIAKLGYQAVAALTAVMPFFILVMAVGAGTGVGVNALASRRFGERNIEEANRVTGQTFFLILILGFIFILGANLFPDLILRLCGATYDIMQPGETYLRILGLATPFFFLGLISRNIFHASGDTVRPLIFTAIGQILNALLDPFLIFGWWIFPEMGVGGAALATVISSGISSILALWYLFKGDSAYQIRFRHCIPNLRVILDIYRVGMPSVIMEAMEGVVFALFNHVAAAFGSVVLAAMGIAMRIFDLAFMPVIGTSHGLLPVVGFCLGARLWQRLWRAVKLTSLGLAGFLAIATVFLEVFTPQIISLFNSDPELLAIAVPGMRIFSITFFLVGPTIIFITTFQGLSKGKEALILNLARQFAFFIPGLYLFSHFFGLTGVWISMPISDLLGALTAGFWLFREYQIQKRSYQQEVIPIAGEARSEEKG